MLGYKLTGNWAKGEVILLAYSDRYTLSILEQLLFRLSTLEVTPMVYIIDKSRKLSTFSKKEIKGGGFLPTGDSGERDEYYYDLMGRFSQVTFVRTREVDFNYRWVFKQSTNKRSIISLGVELAATYRQFINILVTTSETQYIQNSGATRKYIQLKYGVNPEGNSEVELRFPQKNGVLTPGIREEDFVYAEPTRLEQTHEIRMMVNLIINDLLTERYINYTSLSMVEDEIVKERLVLPTLTSLEQSYLYNVIREYEETLNTLLDSLPTVPEGYTEINDDETDNLDSVLRHVLADVSNLFHIQNKEYMSNILKNIIDRVRLIDDVELKGRWIQGVLMLQQNLTYDKLYKRN